MSLESHDEIDAQPLLHEEESLDTLDRYSSARKGPFDLKTFLNQKYVVACALFSSIGGLIFGYGTSVLEMANNRPRNRLGDSRDAPFQRPISINTSYERSLNIFPGTRRILRKSNLFPLRRSIFPKTRHSPRLYHLHDRRISPSHLNAVMDVIYRKSSGWMGSRDVELSCSVVYVRDLAEGN